jgi:Uma2 family endonuclease
MVSTKSQERVKSMNPAILDRRATLDDLSRVEGKAKLIGGRIHHFMASGKLPSRVAFRIAMSLEAHSTQIKFGTAYADGIGYAVPELPSGRESFSPDASLDEGPDDGQPMRFIFRAPLFAAEVRSENDYGLDAERMMEAKREDYFQAGTKVVWDVDPLARTIACYRQDDPTNPRIFRENDIADAEPAVPGWRVKVSDLM